MTKIYSSLFFCLCLTFSAQATDHTIVTLGLAYSPSELTAQIGDNVTIVASGNHPTAEVSEATWNANGTALLAGGFGTHNSSFTFTVETAGTIYYVCTNHVASGMKGRITVLPTSLQEVSAEVGIVFGANPVMDGALAYALSDKNITGAILELYTIEGKLLMEHRIIADRGILAIDQAPGVYLLVLRSNDKGILLSKQVVIEE